jgi:formimidoylglutamase
MRIAHTTPVTWPAARAGRFTENIRTNAPDGCRIALLGLPDDTGIGLNFGRLGAAAGPSAFRGALASFGTSFDALSGQTLSTLVFDAGDVEPASGKDEAALFETHERVEAAARALHDQGLVVVAVGGGHDLSLPTISALARHEGRALGGINVDAHLDVRERVGSGMPFRRLIEAGLLDARRFVELGLGRFANERGDLEWLSTRGAALVLVDQVLREGMRSERWLERALQARTGFLSIDLDGLDAAYAPGVSARNPLGLRIEHAAELAEAAGARAEIRHFDLMELCPQHDIEQRTARAAAYLFLAFMAGYARRES